MESKRIIQMSGNPTYGMYFRNTVPFWFAEREENNESYTETTTIVERILLRQIKHLINRSFLCRIADLGAGAHPDKYSKLISRLRDNQGTLDWVEISPKMILIAQERLIKNKKMHYEKVIEYKEMEMCEYLKQCEELALSGIIMKYTLDCLPDPYRFFQLASRAVQPGGVIVTTITSTNTIPQFSSNAGFFYNGEPVPQAGLKLNDGDRFTLKFLNEYQNPSAGFMEHAETEKYYFSPETIAEIAIRNGFSAEIADWKKFETQLPCRRDLTIGVFKKQ